jgi:hypothetical protein
MLSWSGSTFPLPAFPHDFPLQQGQKQQHLVQQTEQHFLQQVKTQTSVHKPTQPATKEILTMTIPPIPSAMILPINFSKTAM